MLTYFVVKIFDKSFSRLVYNLYELNNNDGFMGIILILFFTEYVYLCKVL